MQFSLKIFTGNKFCLFNYANKETGGYVDFTGSEPGVKRLTLKEQINEPLI